MVINPELLKYDLVSGYLNGLTLSVCYGLFHAPFEVAKSEPTRKAIWQMLKYKRN